MLEGGAQDILQQDLLKAIKLGKVSQMLLYEFKSEFLDEGNKYSKFK